MKLVKTQIIEEFSWVDVKSFIWHLRGLEAKVCKGHFLQKKMHEIYVRVYKNVIDEGFNEISAQEALQNITDIMSTRIFI